LITVATDLENLNAIESLPGSMGAATLGQIMAERRKVKGLVLDGVAPTAAAVLDGTYRHAKTLHLAIGREAVPLAREFAGFAASAEARAIFAANGFLPPAAAAAAG
jgi:ABC-type phosphate transport system substrate-binding protein